MNISAHERRTLLIGGVAAAAILLFAGVIAPLARTWSRRSALLETKLGHVARIRARIEGRDQLLAHRDVLVRRLGALVRTDATAQGDRSEKPAPDAAAQEEPEAATAQDGKQTGQAAATANAETHASAAEQNTASSSEGASPSDEPPVRTAAQPAANETPEKTPTPENEPAMTTGTTPEDEEQAAPAPGDALDGANGGEPAAQQAAPGAGAEAGAAADSETPEAAETAEAVRLATYLERTAAGAGVKIKRIAARRQAGGRKNSEHFRPVTLQVSVDAGIEELLKLLYALEKGDRFVRVEQLQLRRGSDKGGASDATLEIMAYEVAAQ